MCLCCLSQQHQHTPVAIILRARVWVFVAAKEAPHVAGRLERILVVLEPQALQLARVTAPLQGRRTGRRTTSTRPGKRKTEEVMREIVEPERPKRRATTYAGMYGISKARTRRSAASTVRVTPSRPILASARTERRLCVGHHERDARHLLALVRTVVHHLARRAGQRSHPWWRADTAPAAHTTLPGEP